jgi:hypothetical protein
MYDDIIGQEQGRKNQASAADNEYKMKKLNVLSGLLGGQKDKEPNWNDPNVQRSYGNRKRVMGY